MVILMKNSLRRKRLAKSLISACISDQLTRLGVGTKVSPCDKSLILVFESCAVERLMTVSFCSPGGLDELFERVLRFFLFWLVEVSILVTVLPVFVVWKLGLILVAWCSTSMMLFWEIVSLLLMGNEFLVAGWLGVFCLVSDGRMRFNLVVQRKSKLMRRFKAILSMRSDKMMDVA